ncbi:gelsolin-like protein 2 [Haliotis rufescens]|uniref:gelsolin-like protein 2 n=1 Tax=Haliotis rufescens TaxID=6454 RepID=UPI001EB0465E|nr:gelsolin-like protein 2 [Haliotis rufescens]
MSGLRKAKKYDWKDSNLALFGSDTEKQVKKESAESEPAWKGSGQNVGLQIWRIEKFKVVHLPKEDYGNFFSGDSYIVLNTYKEKDSKELKYDVHFWIGKESTQDEYGTAAYKTVELDTFLNDAPVQHREVERHESTMFKGYFKSLTYLKGGIASGFRHVKPEEYKTRLLQFRGSRRQVQVTEMSACRTKLNSNDVFILDTGRKVYQWNGNGCNKDEKLKAVQYIQQLKSDRHGKATSESVEQGDEDEDFWNHFTDEDDDDDDDDDATDDGTKRLYRVTDEGGSMKTILEKEGQIFNKSMLDVKDVFILDTSKEVFLWVGRRASNNEKKNGMGYAHKYLQTTSHPLIPVTVIKEGQTSQGTFNSHFSAAA